MKFKVLKKIAQKLKNMIQTVDKITNGNAQ